MCTNAKVWDSKANPLKENETCVTGPGKVYPWYSKTGIAYIKMKLKDHPNANVVVNMGTNDVSPNLDQGANAPTYYAQKYATLHKQLISEYPNIKLVVVSVTPFDEGEGGAVTYNLTEDLPDKFNNTMKQNISGTNIVYCDVNSKVKSKFGSDFTYDGIHHHANIDKYI